MQRVRADAGAESQLPRDRPFVGQAVRAARVAGPADRQCRAPTRLRAIGTSDLPYRQEMSWDSTYNDVYLVDLKTGARRKVLDHMGAARHDVARRQVPAVLRRTRACTGSRRTSRHGVRVNLTERLPVKFFDESHDSPSAAAEPRHGRLDRRRQVGAAVRPVRHLGNPSGRHEPAHDHGRRGPQAEASCSAIRTLDERRRRARSRRQADAALDDQRRDAGARASTACPSPAARPEKIVMMDKALGASDQGEERRRRGVHGVDDSTSSRIYWVSDTSFASPKKITDANPQQAEFVWGKAENIKYINADGKTLQRDADQAGQLRPDEEVSDDGLHLRGADAGPARLPRAERRHEHQHHALRQQRLRGAAAGHLVRNRLSGPERDEVRHSGDQHVVAQGYIDPKRIGIQGHSWGGYQITYMITQTNIFARGPGGRVGVEHDQRLRRHPLGHGHGAPVPVREDAEPHRRDAVGCAAAVHRELADLLGGARSTRRTSRFTTTRTTPCRGTRASSSTWRCAGSARKRSCSTTTAQPHGLSNRDYMKHWTVHMDEFFDHYLLGKPRPEWMDKGVSFLERGTRDVSGMFKKPVAPAANPTRSRRRQ